MLDRGIEPDPNSLINMYAKCGSIDDAERAFSSIPERGIVSWSAMIGGLAQHGHGKEALRVVLLGAARIHKNVEIGQRTAEMLLTLEPEKSIPMFFLLSLAKMRRLIHVRSEEIYAKLDELSERLSKARYIPKVEFDLHDVERDEKEKLLYHHSEKLAVAFGLIATPVGAPIRIKKNLRVCVDCHTAFKFIIKIVSREIILRDKQIPPFKDGSCSCGDYW
ncbi:hypothetical protein Goklo_006600 [Gossypium klotzschianum]|uniref:DYW domain-containing protein n=1 Tax=Gossypium klotzschianum TaxID=34286 RepID=A0A7J8VIQ1_9ROSI|nr:hypothetical protein [Gossypium klotzschianum]